MKEATDRKKKEEKARRRKAYEQKDGCKGPRGRRRVEKRGRRRRKSSGASGIDKAEMRRRREVPSFIMSASSSLHRPIQVVKNETIIQLFISNGGCPIRSKASTVR